jgi:hypothetical protein
MVYIGSGVYYRDYSVNHQGTTMNLLLDNLFFFCQILSLLGMGWGAWLVLRESLTGIVFPGYNKSSLVMSLSASWGHPFRRIARV